MKVMTIVGTRPELIRLSKTISLLDEYFDHILVHTGQNKAYELNEIFFDELDIRKPNHFLDINNKSVGSSIGEIISKTEIILLKEKPDALIILGDTNSGLSSMIAKRLGIPIFHVEAGNRCYNDEVPEEINRRIIDHTSDILMPYTIRSKNNLLKEGIPSERIFVIGNPINEVISENADKIETSIILNKLKLIKNEYFLVTMHRSENVDNEKRLKDLILTFELINQKYNLPIIISLHPRTKAMMEKFGFSTSNNIKCLIPFGFFDFINLEKNAKCVLTDSGTVQEECCILHVPNLTLRSVTERPETIECGSNILCGTNPDKIIKNLDLVINYMTEWNIPIEYLERNVSLKIVKIVSSVSEFIRF